MNLFEAKARRQELSTVIRTLIAKARGIDARVKAAAREMTPEESQEFDAVMTSAESMKAEAEAIDKEFPHAGRLTNPGQPGGQDAGGRAEAGTGPIFVSSTGERIRGLRHGENFFAASADHFDSPTPVGDAVAAILTGNGGLLAAHNYGSSDSAGGYMLNTELSSRIVDLARSQSVLSRAGAVTVPVSTEEMAILQVLSDPTGHWRAENVAITASAPTFGRIYLRPKVLACIVPISIELMEDAPNAGSVIEGTIAAALALKLDQAGLNGPGAASVPRGLINTVGVNAIGTVASPTYDDISAAVGDILGANYDGEVSSLAWIAHPRDAETYDKLKDGEDRPLPPSPWSAAVRRLYTTSLPTTDGGGGNESTMLVGDFSQLLIGQRFSGLKIEMLPAGTVTDDAGVSHNAVSEMKRYIRAYLRADFAVLRPTWFTKLTGVTA